MKLLKKAMSFTLALLMVISMLPLSAAATEVTDEAQERTPSSCSVSGCEKEADHEGECTVDCTTSGCTKKNGHEGEHAIPQTHTEGCALGQTHEGDCIVCDGTAACPAPADANHKTDCLKIANPGTQPMNTDNDGEEGEEGEGNGDGNDTQASCNGSADCTADEHAATCLTNCDETSICDAKAHKETCKYYTDLQEEINDMLDTIDSYREDGLHLTNPMGYTQALGLLDAFLEEYEVTLSATQQETYDAISNPGSSPLSTDDPQADYVAEIVGGSQYATLAEAISNAADGNTVKLLKSASGSGIVVANGKFPATGLTIDLGGFTYSITNPTVGSSGTETNGFQLNKGNKIKFQNGTLAATTESAKILIQNYADLTLSGVTLTGASTTEYVLSNNNGSTLLTGGTVINAAGGWYAFDVCYGWSSTYPSVSVTVNGATINGKIEICGYTDASAAAALNITSGTLSNASLVLTDVDLTKATITKAAGASLAAPEGYKWGEDGVLVEKHVAAIGTEGMNGYATYKSLADAIAHAATGSTITLLENVEEAIVFGSESQTKTLTLNLNEKTLSNNENNSDIIGIRANGLKLTIAGGSLTTTAAETYGVYLYAEANNVELTLSGVTLSTKTQALGINGNATGNVMTVTDSTITSTNDLGIHYCAGGTLTVTNSNVTGATAIYVKSGTVTINSGKIKATGNKVAYSHDGSGASATGDALVIENCNYPGGSPAVTIKGGTFESAKAYAVGAYFDSSKTTIAANITKTIATDLSVNDGYHWEETATAGTYGLKETKVTIGDKPYSDIEEAAEEAEKTGTPLEQPASSTPSAKLDGNILAVAAETSNVGITIPTSTATVTFDNKAAKTIDGATGDVTLKVEQITKPEDAPAEAVAYEITLKAGETPLFTKDNASANGTATVRIPLPEGVTDGIVYYYDGTTRTRMDTTKVGDYLEFETNHFSTYVIEPALATVEGDKYPTLAEALAVAQAGDTIELADDIALTSDITIDEGITLDLKGHSITGSGYIKIDNATPTSEITVTIKNSGTAGSITTKGADPNANIRVIGKKVKLNLNNVKVEDAAIGMRIESGSENCTVNVNGTTQISGSTAAVRMVGKNTLNVNDTAKLSGTSFGIVGNGNDDKGTTINVNGGTVEGTDTADSLGIYHPQKNGVLNISGGTVKGRTGVEMRAGELNVTGGTIEGFGEYSITDDGSGSTTKGAGIAVAQHTTKSDIEVNISGGTIKSAASGAALSVANPENNTTSNVDVNVTGGSFRGPLEIEEDAYGDDSHKIISGGTFEDELDDKFTTEDFVPVKNPDGSWSAGQPNAEQKLTIKVRWDDDNNSKKLRPKSLKVDLYADGTFKKEYTIKPNTDGTWSFETEKLPIYTDDTVPERIAYAVDMDAIPYYDTTCGVSATDATVLIIDNVLPADEYKITKGAKQKIITGSSAVFVTDVEDDALIEVLVDGKAVDPKHYTKKSDDTKITLSADYIKKLSLGEHTLVLVYGDGAAYTTFTVKKPTAYKYDPDKLMQTGQLNWPIPVMAVLGTAALAAGVWFLLESKKKHYES